MIPFIPPNLAPWIEFVPDGVELKKDAPEELKPAFEEFKKNLLAGWQNTINQ